MKEFDLQAALAGAPVITRSGRKVIDLHFFERATDSQKLFGVMEDKKTLESWCIDGRFSQCEKSSYDLFMAPTKREGWVNIYGASIGGSIYPTKEAAIAAASDCAAHTARVEWEE